MKSTLTGVVSSILTLSTKHQETKMSNRIKVELDRETANSVIRESFQIDYEYACLSVAELVKSFVAGKKTMQCDLDEYHMWMEKMAHYSTVLMGVMPQEAWTEYQMKVHNKNYHIKTQKSE